MIPVETNRYNHLVPLVILKGRKALLSAVTLFILQNNKFKHYWHILYYLNRHYLFLFKKCIVYIQLPNLQYYIELSSYKSKMSAVKYHLGQ